MQFSYVDVQFNACIPLRDVRRITLATPNWLIILTYRDEPPLVGLRAYLNGSKLETRVKKPTALQASIEVNHCHNNVENSGSVDSF